MEKYWRIATRAVNPELLYSNASAMLSSEYWTVEYRAVFDALRRIAAGEFQEEDLEFAIWKQDNRIWNTCELWRMHEIMNDQQEVTMFKVRSSAVRFSSFFFLIIFRHRPSLPNLGSRNSSQSGKRCSAAPRPLASSLNGPHHLRLTKLWSTSLPEKDLTTRLSGVRCLRRPR